MHDKPHNVFSFNRPPSPPSQTLIMSTSPLALYAPPPGVDTPDAASSSSNGKAGKVAVWILLVGALFFVVHLGVEAASKYANMALSYNKCRAVMEVACISPEDMTTTPCVSCANLLRHSLATNVMHAVWQETVEHIPLYNSIILPHAALQIVGAIPYIAIAVLLVAAAFFVLSMTGALRRRKYAYKDDSRADNNSTNNRNSKQVPTVSPQVMQAMLLQQRRPQVDRPALLRGDTGRRDDDDDTADQPGYVPFSNRALTSRPRILPETTSSTPSTAYEI